MAAPRGARRAAPAILLLLLSLAVPPAEAAAPSREQYRDRVEPICARNTEANEQILAGVRRRFKNGQLRAAGAQFSRAGRALGKTLRKLRVVPRPLADRARLRRWFGLIGDEVELFERTGRKLKRGDRRGAQKMVVHLTHTAKLANFQVLPFDFTHCRFNPSKFT